jgi:hypothetical protein
MKINVGGKLDYFSRKPGTLFLIDGLGAALTTLCLFLGHQYGYFGMPAYILKYLLLIGLFYCAYSMSCYFWLKNHWTLFLRIISVANFLYCILTMSLMYSFYEDLTPMGLIYFLGEILLILFLVGVELIVANMMSKKEV